MLKTLRIEFTMRFASYSTESVGRKKYAATLAIKSDTIRNWQRVKSEYQKENPTLVQNHRNQNSTEASTKIEHKGCGGKTLVNISRRDSRTKRKESYIFFTIYEIWDERGFTREIEKINALEVFNIK